MSQLRARSLKKRYKQRVVSNAEGDAARFKQVLAEYSKAPGVMRELHWHATAAEWAFITEGQVRTTVTNSAC